MGAFLLLLGMGGVALWAVNKSKAKAKKAGGGSTPGPYVPPGPGSPPGPGTPYPSPGHVVHLYVHNSNGELGLYSQDPEVSAVLYPDDPFHSGVWVIKSDTFPVRYMVHATGPGILKMDFYSQPLNTQLLAGTPGLSLDLLFETTTPLADSLSPSDFNLNLGVTLQTAGVKRTKHVLVKVIQG